MSSLFLIMKNICLRYCLDFINMKQINHEICWRIVIGFICGTYVIKWWSSQWHFCFCHAIASFIMLKIVQWLWTAHFSWTNQVCGIMIEWGLFTIKTTNVYTCWDCLVWWRYGISRSCDEWYFGYQCLPFVPSKIECSSPNLPSI